MTVNVLDSFGVKQKKEVGNKGKEKGKKKERNMNKVTKQDK